MNRLQVYQIYFDDKQKLEPEYTPVLNKDCTVFFENSRIPELVLNVPDEVEYVGVVSHALRQKQICCGDMKPVMRGEFTPAKFEAVLFDEKPDAMGFMTFAPHDTVLRGSKWHPLLMQYFRGVMAAIGYKWIPAPTSHPFYCNHFVAKTYWYKRYVNEMLVPAMEVMKNNDMLNVDSKYFKKLPKELAKKVGYDHYPYHPFICERMFNFFCNIHNLTTSSY